MTYDYLFLVVNFIFWATLGATEGFKWTSTPNLVTAKNYHIFRGFTNGAFLVTIGLSPYVLSGLSIPLFLLYIFIVTATTWPVYELVLNYVNHGSFIHQKSDFVFGNMKFRHPPAIIIPIIGIIALVGWVYMIYFM